MRLDDVVKECQAAPFAAEGAVTDTRKMSITVKLAAVEDCHDTDIFHVSVLHDGIEDDLPVSIYILKLVPGHLLEELAHGEDSPCTEPTTDMVAGDMIEHGVGRDLEDIVLQLLERADACNLLVRLRVAEDEVAETHVFLQEVTKLQGQHLGVLVHEMEMLFLCPFLVGRLRALHDKRHILVFLADIL